MLHPLENLSTSDALRQLAESIDYALDNQDASLTTQSLDWCDQLEERQLSSSERATIDYLRANAWANRLQAQVKTLELIWAWEQEEIQHQIYFLRRALHSEGFDELDELMQCQILTNLANQLDTVGRFIEARHMWSRALQIEPRFWMARGNRAKGLEHFGNALYDPGHAAVFALEAHTDYLQALADLDKFPSLGDAGLASYFNSAADNVARRFNLKKIFQSYHPAAFALNGSKQEIKYRKWCLSEILFLNPLNDIGPDSIAARDILTLPNFVTKIGDAPVFTGFYNQLKQEFASARWLYFEGAIVSSKHFSDTDMLLYDALDATVLGLSLEKIKIAFRMSYSLLDKIAYFLNRYLDLGIPATRVSFRTIWREKDAKSPIRKEFRESENWPLRGLFWLSKDFFEDGYMDMAEPDARELAQLRNHLEHKYVKVQSDLGAYISDPLSLDFDDFAHSISKKELVQRSLHLLKLARSALMYLALGMHREETRRADLKPESIAMPILLVPLVP